MTQEDIKIAAGTAATGASWVIANELITFLVGLSVFLYTMQRIYLNYKYGKVKRF